MPEIPTLTLLQPRQTTSSSVQHQMKQMSFRRLVMPPPQQSTGLHPLGALFMVHSIDSRSSSKSHCSWSQRSTESFELSTRKTRKISRVTNGVLHSYRGPCPIQSIPSPSSPLGTWKLFAMSRNSEVSRSERSSLSFTRSTILQIL
jgi:hypothetical protein